MASQEDHLPPNPAADGLSQAEQQFRTIFESSPIAIEVYDENGLSVNANRACIELAGVSCAADLGGFSLYDEPNLPENAAAELHAGRSVRFRSHYSFDAVRALGLFPTSRTGNAEMDILISPLMADGHTITGYLLQIQDISERVAAEAALARSEQRYRAVVDSEVEMVVRYLPDATITFANEAFCQAVHLSPEEVLGTHTWLSVPTEDVDVSWVGAGWFSPERPIRQSEHRIIAADGSLRWYQWVDRAIFDEAGNVVEMQSVGRDVTDRVEAESALERRERQYRLLAENMQDALFYHDTHNRLLYANPAAERLTGYSPEEMIAEPTILDRCTHPEDRDSVLLLWRGARHRGAVGRTEFRVITRGGEVKWVSAIVAPSLDHEGRQIGTQTLVSDITERRRLQEQLLQAHKMESVGRLAGGVAHDFNNLLTGICGYVEFALEQLAEDAPVRPDLLEVLHNAERAGNLTRQLLAFSRKQTMAMRSVDLNALVGNLTRLLRRLIGEHIALGLDLGDGLPQVHADPTQIEQVLTNLAVNARDAMPEGGRLTIATSSLQWHPLHDLDQPALPAGEYVCLEVSDTGGGMAPEVLLHLFEPFYTTKELGQGTGLGLATAYGIVKQHGGDITARSEAGRGSVFTIYLPAARQGTADASPESAKAGAAGGGETILLVEDEAVVRSTARRTLERLGYRILEAGNGEEALQLLERTGERPALLVTDLVMPEMGGLELTRRLLLTHPELRILYTSGYTDESVALATELESGHVYLQKPFNGAMLAAKVREALERA